MQGVNVVIGANTQQFTQGMQTVQQQLAATAQQAGRLGGSLQPLNQSVANTGNVFQNFGRVLSDAPFGFIGIQNNIEPLIESFGRLRASTGSIGGAFRALGGSIFGAGGLGILVPAITAAVSFATIGFGAWTRGLGGTKTALDETAKAAKEADDEIKGLEKTVAREILTSKELFATAANENIGRDARLAAVHKLRQEYPEYLKGLSDEQVLSGNIGTALEKINQALSAKVILQAAEQKVLPLIQQQLDLRLQDYKLQQDVQRASLISKADADKAAAQGIKVGGILLTQGRLAQGQLQANAKAYQELQDRINYLFNGFGDFLKATSDLSVKQSDLKEKIDKVAEALRRLAIARGEVANNPLLSFDEKDKQQFDLVANAIKQLQDLGLKNSDSRVVKLRAEFDLLAARVELDKFHALLEKSAKLLDPIKIEFKAEASELFPKGGLKSGLEDGIEAEFKELGKFKGRAARELGKLLFDPKAFKEQAEVFKKQAEQQINTIASTVADSFAAIGEAIGSGTGIKGIFSGIAQVFGEGLKTLGKQVIEASTVIASLKKALNAAFGGNPVAGVLAGVGLIAIGTLLEKSLPKFAEGGIVTGPTVGLIGEAGPEVIFPLNKLQQFLKMQGGGGTVNVELAVRGNDLHTITGRNNTSRSRLNGVRSGRY